MLDRNTKIFRHIALLLSLSIVPMALAQEDVADVLHDKTLDMKRPADRAKAVARMKIIEDKRLKNAQARGRALGIPLQETLPNGGWRQLVDFDGERPVFIASRNANAAISTGANLTWTSPHNLNGSGLIVGVWDGGVGRATHQEFATGSRLVNIDGGAMNDHAMHVAGTIAALGVNASARGMANAAKIHAYDASNDSSEMTAAGANFTGQTATKIHTSNHSYGPADGWIGSTWTGTGIDQNAFDPDFGRYSYGSRQIDSVIYNTPYLASFWACGNERSDNPANGSTVSINGQSVIYNSAVHPLGDGVYRGGFETINAESLGKNIIAIGAVEDAVTAGSRDPLKATITSFSSTGPADDGRIKPDLVANGAGLFSTGTNADTHYWSASGTSMASPNACGSATLLVDQYNRLLSSAMRASTLKALLIHTADDIGRPGPDYFYGWGLINVKKGADLIASHASSPLAQQITESNVSTTTTTREYSFVWNGSSPISATIAWTDPAANEVTAHDSRTPVLVNNLNLKIIAPNGAEYFPYTMPFVGTWTIASMSLNATTGINNIDNVEQVRIANPGQAGIWRAVVSYAGVITNTTQDFGLIISGLSSDKNLMLNLNASSVSEAGGNGATTGTVSRVGTSGDFVVSLSSSNTSKITVPASVTIANGQTTSPSFPINAIDNLVIESTTTANITASASGYLPTTAVIHVTDNDNSVPVVSAGPDQTVFLNNTSPTQLGWSYSAWTGDADSNISDQYVYTAAHCFGNNHASVTVNNVSFTENFNTSGTGWSVGGAVTNWDGNDDAAVTGSSESLAQEFIYNGSPRTVTFSGLTAGQTYEVIFYSAGWDAVDSRVQTFSGTSQTSLVLNQNFYGDNKGIKISCIYVATETSQTFTITPTTGTFHLYAMLNRRITLSSATANLDGTVSDANGHALTTNWTFVSGPAAPMIGNASSVDTAATFYTAGAYTFHLTVNDGFSQVTDEVVVHVNPAGSGYTMTYAGNGSTDGSIPVDGTQYTLNATVTVLGNTGSLIRSGYTFNSWNTAANGTGISYLPGATFNINTNTTLYAKWIPNTYIVTFNKQSGSGGSSSVNATSGSAMPVATAPTRTGFTFGGYYTQVSGGGIQYYNAAMASSRSWDIATNTTLNAHWIANTYTVTLNTQSGTGGTGSVIASYDSAMPTATAPRRTGYFFGGYYTQIAGGGTQYYTATMASTRNWDIPAATTLYAKWNSPPLVNAGNDQTVQTGPIAPGPLGITYLPITNDADSGISSSKTYTHALDFGSDTNRALINGVKFQAGGATFGSISGTSATIGTGSTTIPSANAGNTNAAPYLNGASVCAMEDLVKDMNYNAANGVITLTGLTPGVPYQFRLYNRAYGTAAATRGQNIGFDINGVGTTITASEYTAAFNADDARTSGPSFATFSQVYALTLDYVLAPGVTSLKVYINATSAATYHLYGLTNEESPRVAATAMLDGTVSNAGDIPLTATWSLVSGPGTVIFGNANAIDTAATFYVAGTYTLRLTLSDGVAQSTDDVVVTVVQGTPYTTWASSSFANPLTDPTSGGDPDGDGLNNLLEFAFGTDPTVGSSGPIRFLTGGNIITNGVPDIMNFAVSGQPAEFHAVFARRKDHAAAGLSYTVQFSSDLNLWTPSAAGLQVETGASNTSDIEAVSVPFPSSVPLQIGGNAVPKFFRVGVSGG